jgi:hypothetical protein
VILCPNHTVDVSDILYIIVDVPAEETCDGTMPQVNIRVLVTSYKFCSTVLNFTVVPTYRNLN